MPPEELWYAHGYAADGAELGRFTVVRSQSDVRFKTEDNPSGEADLLTFKPDSGGRSTAFRIPTDQELMVGMRFGAKDKQHFVVGGRVAAEAA